MLSRQTFRIPPVRSIADKLYRSNCPVELLDDEAPIRRNRTVPIRLCVSQAKMRKARHQVGFLETADDKPLFYSRYNGGPLQENRIMLMRANV